MKSIGFARLFSFLAAFMLLVPGLWMAYYMDSIRPPTTLASQLDRQGASLTPKEFLALGGININEASLEQLKGLPGVGDTLAQRIVDHRKENGDFTHMEQLLQIKGIGEKTLERMMEKGYIVVV